MNSKGHVFLAQNSKTNYVNQAYCLAASIKRLNCINETCIITNDFIPEDYLWAFDHVVTIPWSDDAIESDWKIENRWKIIHATPFKENLVYDTDMLLMTSNDHWWDSFFNDVALTTTVYDYKGRVITSDYYRKVFTANNLPNVYTGIHYFKKSNRSFEFYKWLEIITKNYQEFYKKFANNNQQKFCSMDVNAALAVKFMSAEKEFSNNVLSFTHMKSALQGWTSVPSSWRDVLSYDITNDLKLKVGNFLQTGVFHYVDDMFQTQELVDIMEKKYG